MAIILSIRSKDLHARNKLYLYTQQRDPLSINIFVIKMCTRMSLHLEKKVLTKTNSSVIVNARQIYIFLLPLYPRKISCDNSPSPRMRFHHKYMSRCTHALKHTHAHMYARKNQKAGLDNEGSKRPRGRVVNSIAPNRRILLRCVFKPRSDHVRSKQAKIF